MGCFSRGALHRNPTILLCPWGHKHRVRPDNHSTTSASPLETPAPPQTESPSSLPVCSRLLRDRDPDHPHLHRPGLENLHRQQKHRDLVLCGNQPWCKLDFAVLQVHSSSPRKLTNQKCIGYHRLHSHVRASVQVLRFHRQLIPKPRDLAYLCAWLCSPRHGDGHGACARKEQFRAYI